MSSVSYALLSLLARNSLSGYDIKQQMNSRLGPFWKVGSNQVYPELAKMEKNGWIKMQKLEQHTYRPARKIYEITDKGREELIQWILEATGVGTVRDDFLLKAYNAWLIEPEKMISQIDKIKKQHEEHLAAYRDKILELNKIRSQTCENKDPIESSISVIEFGIKYEHLYIEWCEGLKKSFLNK